MGANPGGRVNVLRLGAFLADRGGEYGSDVSQLNRRRAGTKSEGLPSELESCNGVGPGADSAPVVADVRMYGRCERGRSAVIGFRLVSQSCKPTYICISNRLGLSYPQRETQGDTTDERQPPLVSWMGTLKGLEGLSINHFRSSPP